MSYSSFAELAVASFRGAYSLDSDLMSNIYDFAEFPGFSVADRAGALRLLAVDGLGATGPDAGIPLSDAYFLQLYLDSL